MFAIFFLWRYSWKYAYGDLIWSGSDLFHDMGTKKSCAKILTARLALKRSALRGFFDMICWGVLKAIGFVLSVPKFSCCQEGIEILQIVGPFWLSMSFSTVYPMLNVCWHFYFLRRLSDQLGHRLHHCTFRLDGVMWRRIFLHLLFCLYYLWFLELFL